MKVRYRRRVTARNMKHAITCFSWLGVIGVVCPAEAQTILKGPGGVTCGEYAETYRRDPAFADFGFFSWVQGYMSGINFSRMTYNNGITKGLADFEAWPFAQQKGYFRDYCNNHPLATVSQAAAALYTALPTLNR
jgi:hypothetical protein